MKVYITPEAEIADKLSADTLEILKALSPAAKTVLLDLIGMSVSKQFERALSPLSDAGKMGALIGGIFGAALGMSADPVKKSYTCTICGANTLPHKCAVPK